MSQIDADELLDPLRRMHNSIRDAVVASCESQRIDELASIEKDDEGDTIYAVDRVSEHLLVEFMEREAGRHGGIVLVAEGLAQGQIVLPRGTSDPEARWRIIVDPVDGSRGLMYQKRSAWILTGVARNRGPRTDLQNVELALQTEIPLVKQHLSDTLWARRGGGLQAERHNRLSGTTAPLAPRPSRSTTLAHGFAMIARFFPGARDTLAAIDEDVILATLGPVRPGKAHCFEDQYISTGGQIYELIMGHDRFVADLRPLLDRILADRGQSLGICCHPYDLCTGLLAEEAGVIITDERGRSVRAPLAVEPNLAWIGYANAAIRSEVEPHLRATLHRRGLLD